MRVEVAVGLAEAAQVLVERYEAPGRRPPFNVEARSAAGFSDEEIAYLSS